MHRLTEHRRPPELFALPPDIPPAQMYQAGKGHEITWVHQTVIEIHAGPPAPYPVVPTGRAYQQAIEDEWLRREWRRAWGQEP